MSAAEVLLMFQAHALHGIKVIRVFAHSDGYGFPGNIPTPWYVNEAIGTNASKNLFYTHPACKLAYKKYVNMLINRKNTITGTLYRDDPTIFAWDLMNEPHTTDNYEINQGLPPGQQVLSWISEMASFVKSLDSNHLVTTGEEGYRVKGNTTCCIGNWMNGGVKGVDFDSNVADPNIDFATVHAYPDNWGVPADDYQWYGPNFLADRAAIAHGLGKPIVMEEYGSREGYLSSRDLLLNYLQDEANAQGYAGSIVWSLRHLDSDTGGYVFSYTQDGSSAVLAQLQRADALAQAAQSFKKVSSAPAPAEEESATPAPAAVASPPSPAGQDSAECSSCEDTMPDSTYTCAQQAAWGKCSESWLDGYCNRSCGRCSCSPAADCTDTPPTSDYSCPQQAAWGKCDHPFMASSCNKSCRRC